MLAVVYPDPEKTLSSGSWASILDAATSISSTIFFEEPLLRMPTAIQEVFIHQNEPVPEVCYIYVEKVAASYTTNVYILTETGRVLGTMYHLRFAGIEGNFNTKTSVGALVHQLAWPPAQMAEDPIKFAHVLFVANRDNPLLKTYRERLDKLGFSHDTIAEPVASPQLRGDTIIVVVADAAKTIDDVYEVSATSCQKLLTTIKHISQSGSQNKVFCVTRDVSKGVDASSLSQAPLHGLARIIKSEEPDIFGGLIDVEDDQFPLQAIRYVQGPDVIRIEDTVARNARLRPFAGANNDRKPQAPLRLRPYGTYIITGGLGALGLEIAAYLAEKGAKRLVLISRRRFAPRQQWSSSDVSTEIQRILAIEATGVSVHPLSVDMTAPNASAKLRDGLDSLGLPPVLGVVHAAGVLAN